MNKKLFSVVALASFVVSAVAADESEKLSNTPTNQSESIMAEASSAPSKLDFIEQNGQKFIHVSTINTVEANQQFMQNVNIVNQQRQQIGLLTEANKVVQSKEAHDALAKEIETAAKKLDENNAIMAKQYGYSLTRQYIHAIVKTRIFIKLSDEEYKKAKEDPETKADDLLVRGNDKFRLIAIIPTVDENNLFRRNVQLVQTQRNQLVQMKQAEASATGEDKAKLEEQIKTAEETLVKNNDEMVKRYGFSLNRDYLVEIEESKLYTLATEEEFLKAEKEAADRAIAEGAKAIVEDSAK